MFFVKPHSMSVSLCLREIQSAQVHTKEMRSEKERVEEDKRMKKKKYFSFNDGENSEWEG